MRINITYIVLVISTALALSGCAVTDMDRKTDFSKMRSFTFGSTEVNSPNPVYAGDFIEKNIRMAVRDEFAKKGITYKPDSADLVVNFQTHTENKVESRVSHAPFGPYYGFYRFGFFPWGFWGMPYGFGPGQYVPQEYTYGTLVIDVTEPQKNEVIWRGSVSGKVDNVKALQKQIRKAVKAIVKKYPEVSAPVNDDSKDPLPADDWTS